jgi:hypothetical protein
MLRLFNLFDTPERRELLNGNMRNLADEIVLIWSQLDNPIPLEYVDFDNDVAAPAHREGRVFYDRENKTFALYNDKTDVTLQLGQEQYVRAVNKTVSQIDNGTLVYIDGADAPSGRPTIALALSDAAATAGILGMTTHDIAVDEEGLVTTFGLVRGLNTNGIAAGTHLHLSDTVAGEWQAASPFSPNFIISIGTVIVESLTEGVVLVQVGPRDVINHMTIHNLWVNTQFGHTSVAQEVSAAVAIDPTHSLLRVMSDGGVITMTADPQIAVGRDGQVLHIQGESDTDRIILNTGTGLRLNGSIELFEHDQLQLMYDEDDARWEEVSRSFSVSEKNWAMQSKDAGAGTNYLGGYYTFHTGNNNFSATQTHGSANAAYGAHLLVVLGEVAVDEISITVAGTSITDEGVRVTSDTQVITIPDGSAVGDYFETPKKWLGQVTITNSGGTAKECNWGYAKYWDNANNDFIIAGFEATWLGGANDANAEIALIHHKSTGWTYNAGAEPDPPIPVATMRTDYATELNVVTGEPGAWKRVNFNEIVAGGSDEGIIIQVDVGVAKAFATGNFMLRVRGR